MMYRAGGAAAVFAIAVSGGAYAATQIGDASAPALTESQARLGAIGSDVTSQGTADPDTQGALTVATTATQVSTETEDTTTAHGSVQKETDDLLQGETQVETQGVDGVTRTTYQVTKQGDTEVSRQAVSTVVVTQEVDEVVLVGTGVAPAVTTPAATTDSSSTTTGTTSGSSSTTTAATAATGTSATSAQALASSMISSYGWGSDQFSCLVNLWNRESGWSYTATNASSGAYGIPQALPGSKMASSGSDWKTNPATQIAWGLNYISGRYGSPCSAWAHSESTGWY